MAARSFIDPSKEHVMGLGKEDAVNLLNGLIYAELARLKLYANNVSVPFEVDIPDGGIDATLSGLEVKPMSDLLFKGQTYYQSKSGDSVGIADGGLRDIVFEETTPKTKRKLKPKIKSIAEKDGNLVLFLPGISKPKVEEAEENLLKIIKETVPSTNLQVRILQADNIVGILQPHFALRMLLMRGNTAFMGVPYDIWADEPSMSNHFEHDEKRDMQIDNIRSLLFDSSVNDVRVSGFPGNGKTRSVLQAVSVPELASQVLYFAKPSQALDSNNLQEIAYQDNLANIIIIDECDRISHAGALAIIGRSRSDLKLVTIYNEDGNQLTGDIKYVDLNTSEKLSEEAIKKILESYGPTGEDAGRWAQYCDGSPRMAHMIGENLRYNKSDILKNPGYDEAMELCISNRDQIDSDAFTRRKRVLMWLSLFTKFGWSQAHSNERLFILTKIMRFENLSEGDIEEVIQQLKSRKILQGDKTLYISPRLLQVRAWKWWWEKYSHTFDIEKFWEEQDIDNNMIEVGKDLETWFNDMFQYAAEAPGAAEVVKKLLTPGGPLDSEEQLVSAINSNFFLKLTEANPADSLALISRWMRNKEDRDLEMMTIDRQKLVRQLEAMAVWRPHFVEATRLLLRLARTEINHTYSNNSEGVFSDMFSNGYGKVAVTEAAPSERLIVLQEALSSSNQKEVVLAIRAIYKSLEMDQFTKFVGAEIQGLKREPNLWMPKNWGELWDAAKNTWDLLVVRIPTLEGEALEKACGVVTDRVRGLLRVTRDNQKYLEDFISLVDRGFIPYEEALKTVSLIIRYEDSKLGDDIKIKLKEFYISLEGDDISGNLKRYVGTNVMEDWWGDDGEKEEETQKKLETIAQATLADPSLLTKNTWLFTIEAKNGYRFGLALASLDNTFRILPKLLEQQKKSTGDKSSVFLLSGYMQGIQKRDITMTHDLIDSFKTDEYFLQYLIELIWRTELDEYTGKIILQLLREDKIDYREIAKFKLGAAVKNISDDLFNSWVENLLNRNDITAHTTAVDIFLSHYVFQMKKQLPKDLTKKLLSKKTLGSQANRQISHDIEWDWSQVATRYIEQYPEDVDYLINFLVKYYGKKKSIFESHHEAAMVLTKLARLKPKMIWDKVATEISKGRYFDTYSLESWLQGEVTFGEGRNPGAIRLLDKEMLLSWIDTDPVTRAPLVARMIPHDFGFNSEPNKSSWLRIILDKYGTDRTVINAINANLWSGGYSGPSSQHYAAKLEDIKRFKSLNQESVNIQNWSNDYISGLEQRVEDAKIREERDRF